MSAEDYVLTQSHVTDERSILIYLFQCSEIWC